MGRIAGQDYDYPISLFLHSFTFLDRQNPRNIQVDDAAIHRFEGMLRFVSQSNSFDFWDIGEDSFQMPSYESWMYQDCPAVRGKVRQIKYLLLVAWRIRHMNRKARWLIGMCMGAGVFLLAAILILIFLWGGALL